MNSAQGELFANRTHGADPDVAELISRGALFALSHSGGKDSQAMMLYVLERVPPKQVVVLHASLGEIEWEGALELAETQARDAGVPFVVARAGKSLLDMVEHRYATRPEVPSWPSHSSRQCTSDLKRGPLQRELRRYAKANGFSLIVNCMGLRAEESTGRAKQSPLRFNEGCSKGGREWYDWLPVHSWTTDQVLSTIRAAGQQPHFAYYCGNDRLSCVFCIYGSARDLANGARHRPELAARYMELEVRTGYSMHVSRRPLHELIAQGQRENALS